MHVCDMRLEGVVVRGYAQDLGLSRVEQDLRGQAHCHFCGARITKGTNTCKRQLTFEGGHLDSPCSYSHEGRTHIQVLCAGVFPHGSIKNATTRPRLWDHGFDHVLGILLWSGTPRGGLYPPQEAVFPRESIPSPRSSTSLGRAALRRGGYTFLREVFPHGSRKISQRFPAP
jgi:hypothetical protein